MIQRVGEAPLLGFPSGNRGRARKPREVGVGNLGRTEPGTLGGHHGFLTVQTLSVKPIQIPFRDRNRDDVSNPPLSETRPP